MQRPETAELIRLIQIWSLKDPDPVGLPEAPPFLNLQITMGSEVEAEEVVDTEETAGKEEMER